MLGKDYYGSKLNGFVILPANGEYEEAEALRLLADPLIPATEVIGKEYDLLVVLNYPQQDCKKPFHILRLDQVDQEELFC